MSGSEPLLLLDVDGVLNPYPGTPDGYAEYAFFPDDDEPVRLCADHGRWLRELAGWFEIVWATGWGEEANRLICPAFGLQPLPVIPLPSIPFDPRAKLPAVAAYAGERPVAWVDDIVTDEARAWADERPQPTLIVEIDPARGLAREHVDTLTAWAASLGP